MIWADTQSAAASIMWRVGVSTRPMTFSIDANGIVSVSAQDKVTGLEQATQITPSSGLAPDEIEKLILESETSIDRDKEMRDIILQRNRLDSLITNTRKALLEFGKNLS